MPVSRLVDLIYARRPIARRLLETAAELDTALSRLRVVSAEGLPDDPPIVAGGSIDHIPCSSADPCDALDDLMAAVDALCPTWPHRAPLVTGACMLL